MADMALRSARALCALCAVALALLATPCAALFERSGRIVFPRQFQTCLTSKGSSNNLVLALERGDACQGRRAWLHDEEGRLHVTIDGADSDYCLHAADERLNKPSRLELRRCEMEPSKIKWQRFDVGWVQADGGPTVMLRLQRSNFCVSPSAAVDGAVTTFACTASVMEAEWQPLSALPVSQAVWTEQIELEPLDRQSGPFMCLHGDPDAAQELTLQPCAPTLGRQWTHTSLGELRVRGEQQDLCLSATPGESWTLALRRCVGSSAQRWRMEGELWTNALVASAEDDDLCVDNDYNKHIPGNPVHLFKCRDAKPQHWKWRLSPLAQLEDPQNVAVTRLKLRMRGSRMRGSQLCLSPGNKLVAATATRLEPCEERPSEGWELTRAAQLRWAGSTLCLEAWRGEGTVLHVGLCRPNDNDQRFEWSESGGVVWLGNRVKCIDNFNNRVESGNMVHLYGCNIGPAQRWDAVVMSEPWPEAPSLE